VESNEAKYEWTFAGSRIRDDCEDWSKPERKMIDGTCFE